MNWKRAFLLSLLVVPVIWALAAGFGRDPHAVPSMLVGKAAPSFTLIDMEGRTINSNDLRGRPLMVNFWATWCYPCQAEHALLQATARTHADRLTVLGVVYQDGLQATRRYLSEYPSAYRHVMDHNSTVSLDYGVAGVPETFFIDAEGTVVHKHAGALTPDVLTRVLGPMLKRGPQEHAHAP